jgi:hypothetical protein
LSFGFAIFFFNTLFCWVICFFFILHGTYMWLFKKNYLIELFGLTGY